MNRIQFQVKIFFLGLFALITAGLWGYQIYYVKPAQACEDAGKWWYKQDRSCLQPVKITDLTGRHMDDAPTQPPTLAPYTPAAPYDAAKAARAAAAAK